MCLSPIRIKNVNRGLKNPLLQALGRDLDSQYMEVPCGHCEQCIAARQNAFVQRIEAESRYNHLFFTTLTYDNEHLPRLTVEVPVHHTEIEGVTRDVVSIDLFDERDSDEYLSLDSFGESSVDADLADARARGASGAELKKILDDARQAVIDSHTVGESLDDPDSVDYEPVTFAYADIHDVQLLVKNVRDNNPLGDRTIRYVCVSELGKQNGRPHFHILWLVEHRPDDFDPNGKPIAAVMHTLEASLRTAVRKYWAVNIGTRKHPVYEPRFRYARRWSFGRVYTNFDLHWVDPSLTPGQTSNVAYYVSKYMMKGSDRDLRRKLFLKLNLTETEYESVWKVIKCRMTCSKGLGLDARFETIENVEEQVEYRPMYEVAEDLIARSEGDDLPSDEEVELVRSRTFRTTKKRLLVPNFELAERLRSQLSLDKGVAPGPIFIDVLGNHRPLSHYYYRFGYILSVKEAVDIVLSYTGPDKEPPTKEEYDASVARLSRRLRQVDAHSTFDNVSTVDMPEDDPTLKTYIF